MNMRYVIITPAKDEARAFIIYNGFVDSDQNGSQFKVYYNGFVDSDQNGSQFKVYLLTIK